MRGYVRRIAVEAGETVYEGHSLLFVEEADVEVKGAAVEETIVRSHPKWASSGRISTLGADRRPAETSSATKVTPRTT